MHEDQDWPADEATEPEGATFLVSNPYVLVTGGDGTHVAELWGKDEPKTRTEHSSVFTSSRTVLLEATAAHAIADASLFEDVTEPTRSAVSVTALD